MIENYTLVLKKQKAALKLSLSAKDNNHAQAQAIDIARALNADKSEMQYGRYKETCISELFKNLAENNFTHNECSVWTQKESNGVPCMYALGARHYVRNVILKYLDIPKDGIIAKAKCCCKACVNPYHFTYVEKTNEKISCGDLKLLVAYRSQGASIAQIAKALNVHRSTIYRKLRDESVFDGPEDHR